MNKIWDIAYKKIIFSTLCLLLLLLFYFVPSNEGFDIDVKGEIGSTLNENYVYLLDDDNYVSRVVSYYNSSNIYDEVKNRINILKYGNVGFSSFYPLLNKNVRINNLKIDKNKIYLDFSSEFLNVNSYIELPMVEAIVFSLTEINGIDEVYISVDGVEFRNLPNSKMDIPYPLTRNIGINKEYNLNSFNDVVSTTIFFLKNIDGYEYYVPVTKVSNSIGDKIEIIVSELKSSVNAQSNLNGIISSNVNLVDYEVIGDKLDLVFNENIFSDGVILEEVKYMISYSVFENYDVSEVVFNTLDIKNIEIVKKN